MKILKKVISAVIAMAIAGSMIPASLAAKVELTDVADTASYATAVKTLVALDVINGYEDDTFRPDNEITRAEAAKVVVAALNMTEVANGKPGATGFVDVADDFWANGFINVGVDEEIINGREGNTFAPAANVTIAEMAKMLVVALGYEEYAQYLGGWSKGYMKIADDEGITAGVSGNNNDAATRAQVAQMVYNALNTPIVVNTGMEYSDNGKLVPTIAKMDGKKTDVAYKTLLTEKFDAYLVEGYVVETAKSDGTLEADEIEFAVAKAQKYDRTDALKQTAVVTSLALAGDTERQLRPVAVGETDAADYLGTYGTAIVAVNEFDEYELIDFQPSGKNKTVTFAASDIEVGETAFNGTTGTNDDVIAVYESETATTPKEYKLDENLKLYVNGVSVDAAAGFATYVTGNTTATVELVDTYRVDGKYDTIYVDYYATTQITSIVANTKRVFLKDNGNITLDEENENLTFNIYYNGEEITFADLAKDDVLSIAYDVTGTLATSEFYDIYVSRDVATGKLTKIDDTDYTFGGEVYNFVGGATPSLEVSKEYTLNLDYFGNIYASEINTSAVKYAIVEKVKNDEADSTYKVTLYTAEGTTKTYAIDKNTSVNGTVASVATNGSTLMSAVYQNPANTTAGKKAVYNRVVEYTINTTTGNIKEITFITDPVAEGATLSAGVLTEGTQVEFEAAKSKIGAIRMNDATKVIDAINYYDAAGSNEEDTSMLAVASKDDALDDGTDYIALAYGDKVNNAYPLVLVLAGDASYNEFTRFAVVTGNITELLDEATDTTVKAIEVLYNGEVTTLSIDASVTILPDVPEVGEQVPDIELDDLKKGDVILFQNGADGLVDQIDRIFTVTDGTLASKDALTAASLVETLSAITLTNASEGVWADVGTWNDKTDKFQLVYGPVMEVTSSYITIGKVDNDGTNNYTDLRNNESAADGCYDIDITDDTNAYVWDFSITNDEKNLTVGNAASVRETQIATLEGFNAADGEKILWDKTQDGVALNQVDVTYAFVLVYDGEAVDVLAFEN